MDKKVSTPTATLVKSDDVTESDDTSSGSKSNTPPVLCYCVDSFDDSSMGSKKANIKQHGSPKSRNRKNSYDSASSMTSHHHHRSFFSVTLISAIAGVFSCALVIMVVIYSQEDYRRSSASTTSIIQHVLGVASASSSEAIQPTSDKETTNTATNTNPNAAKDKQDDECTTFEVDPATGEPVCVDHKKTQEKKREARVNLDNIVQSDCIDEEERCRFWANHGECQKNPSYMLRSCRKSCNSCSTIKDIPGKAQSEIQRWTQASKDFGEEQTIEGGMKEQTYEVVKKSVTYMKNLKENKEDNEHHTITQKVLDSCINRHALCSFWSALGECEANPAYMVTNCAPSCYSCHMIDFDTRCPKKDPNDPNHKPGLVPGGLNKMFKRIVKEGQSESTNYTVNVHSKPKEVTIPKRENEDEPDVMDGPWVVTFDNFISDTECDQLVQLGYQQKDGYQRSKDVGEVKFDGTFDGYESKSRTSSNAWCSAKEGCRFDPVANLIMERLANVTGIPKENSEDFQLLRYEVGQFYRKHHDYIGHQKQRQCGPRILTFFLYLSDVEAGGGTAFPRLGNLTVIPKKGRALLWPSVLDSDPSNEDARTQHEALPVFGGLKYAANAWIHLYDYINPQTQGCT